MGLNGKYDPKSFAELVSIVTQKDLEIRRIVDVLALLRVSPRLVPFNDDLVASIMQICRTSFAFRNSTTVAEGRGFIAMHMTFRNTAGPEKGQAVAMRSSSDHSIFYQCSFEAYQDTLYVHANRQFYRDCHITRTIDFIFGNAAIVLQNCTIQPREPLPKQFIAITAHSKLDPNQNIGICIQGCYLTTTFNNQIVTAHTYLGRPWKNYSTTVAMHSKIDQLLNPQGWTEWIRNVTPPETIFYGEYTYSNG